MIKVCLLHSLWKVCDAFDQLACETIPDVKLFHVADDSLIQRLLAAGGLTPAITRRVCDHITAAADAGAGVVQLTCSSLSPCAPLARQMTSIPVLCIDDPMLRSAVQQHARNGLIATNPATLRPSVALTRDLADEEGRDTVVVECLVEGAYDALFTGDMAAHDRLVKAALENLMRDVDAVCLAQASMARIVEQLPEDTRAVPIYSSPQPAMQRLAATLRELRAASFRDTE